VIPDIAYALLWLWLLNPLYGPLSAAVEAVGLTSPRWLTEPWVTRIAIAVMSAFQIGEGFVVALAARRALSPSIYEAAAVDGAKPWFTLTRITLPLMAPILALLAFRDLILSFQLNFVPALIVTDGGPRLATTFLPLYIYRSAFTYFRFGYASAMSATLFLFTVAVVYAQYRLIRRWRRA
jgi:multiple sugar transport system permease protein